MSRPILLIFASQSSPAKAIYQYLSLFIPQNSLPHQIDYKVYTCVAELFDELDQIEAERLKDTIVLLDIGGETKSLWNVRNIGKEKGLAAQLVLSYPEIYFIFIGISGNLAIPKPIDGGLNTGKFTESYHFVAGYQAKKILELIKLHEQGFRTIFDATGLRSFLKQELIRHVGGASAGNYLKLLQSRSKEVAASADEEKAFVYLNGYSAYKIGFRTWLLSSEKEFFRILPRKHPPGGDEINSSLKSPDVEKLSLLLSDWEFVYSDHEPQSVKYKSSQESLSLSPEQLQSNPSYQDVSKYLLLQVDFSSDEEVIIISGLFEENAAHKFFLEQPKRSAVKKPYTGVFDIIHSVSSQSENSKLLSVYENIWGHPKHPTSTADKKLLKAAAIKIKNSINITKSQVKTERHSNSHNESVKSHTVPYARSLVATRLLKRANQIKRNGEKDTESWIQMALLAGEAKEILAGLSQTTAFAAIALQNEAEVYAEVSLFGSPRIAVVTERLDLLEEEGNFVSPSVKGKKSASRSLALTTKINFLLQTVSNLRLQYTEYELVEAAETCLRRISEYKVDLSANILPRFGISYLNWVSNAGTSVSKLILISSLLIFVFGMIYFGLILTHPLYKFDSINNIYEQNQELKSVITPSKSVEVFTPYQSGQENTSDADRNAENEGEGQINEIENTNLPAFSSQKDLFYHYGNLLLLAQSHSLLSFIELQPGITEHEILKIYQICEVEQCQVWIWIYRVVIIIELLFAYLHLGILISLLYRRLTQRAP